jgi:hypothetical protein
MRIKTSCRGSQGAWRQDELIGGKPPVVKKNFDFGEIHVSNFRND